jgi:hypothetical protein
VEQYVSLSFLFCFPSKGTGLLLSGSSFTLTKYCANTLLFLRLVHLNEADFPEPHVFRPERFTEGREYPGSWGHSAFGWGRRICPGMHLGEASVSINIARMLWGFDIRPVKGKDGRDIDVDM